MPNVQHTLGRLAGSNIFSTLDISGAFHCISIHPEDRPYTAFATPWGQKQFKDLGFGLCNGPATYCRLVQLVLQAVPHTAALPYMDDAIVHGANLLEHLANLRLTFEAYRKAGLKLSPAKCEFFVSEANFLGHKLTEHGIEPTDAYKDAVRNMPVPETKQDARSFLGILGYYRLSIPNYTHVALPWIEATGGTAGMDPKEAKALEKKPLKVTEDMRKSFQLLKKALLEAPIRGYPYFNDSRGGSFILDTDWCKHQIAGVLSQKQRENDKAEWKEVALMFASHKLSKTQSNYAPYKGELFAGSYYFNYYAYYLKYAESFLWRTDHYALLFYKTCKDLNDHVSRHLDTLESYNFVVQHRAGIKHGNADGLSRLPAADKIDDLRPYMVCALYRKEDPSVPAYALAPHIVSRERPLFAKKLESLNLRANEIRKAQAEDDMLPLVINAVREKNPKLFPLDRLDEAAHHYLRNKFRELLFSKDQILRCRRLHPKTHQEVHAVCLPPVLQWDVVKAAHRQLGHAGVARTYEYLLMAVYFPHMIDCVTEVVSRCGVCQFIRKPQKGQKHTAVIPANQRPFGRVHIDFVGPFPPGEITGNRYLLTMRDAFTRWPEAISVPDETATSLCRALEELFSRHGVPHHIHSDRAQVFDSYKFKQLQNQYGFLASRTTGYHPQGNGLVERMHRDLGKSLRALSYETGQNWETVLPQCLFALRAGRCDSLGLTPFYAMYGRHPGTPLNHLADNVGPLPDTHMESDLFQRIRHAHRVIRGRQKYVVARRQMQYKEKCKEKLELNDLVLLCTPAVKRNEVTTMRKIFNNKS